MRRLLIVSPHFPPVNAPDHQRVRMSLPYYRSLGWEPTVLAVAPRLVDAPQDPLLEAAIPGDVRVIRCSAVPSRWARKLGIGNIGYRAWPSLRRAARDLLAAESFDLAFFSTTQFIATTLGPGWRRKYRLPYVIDIQDPWRTDYYSRPGSPPPPGGWKHLVARASSRLEGPTWREAAGFISVSQAYLDDLRNRYAWFAVKPCVVLPFGTAASDFSVAQSNGVPVAFEREPGCVHLVSVGAAGPIMRPALEALFGGVAKYRELAPEAAARLRFHFIGTSYAPGSQGEPSVAPLAEARGVGHLVREQTARVGHFCAIKTLIAADALVLLGSDDPAYNPSRVGPYFLARRPLLTVAGERSSLERAAGELGLAPIARFGSEESADTIASFLAALANGGSASLLASRNEALFDHELSAGALTRKQCAFFDKIVGSRK